MNTYIIRHRDGTREEIIAASFRFSDADLIEFTDETSTVTAYVIPEPGMLVANNVVFNTLSTTREE